MNSAMLYYAPYSLDQDEMLFVGVTTAGGEQIYIGVAYTPGDNKTKLIRDYIDKIHYLIDTSQCATA